MFYHNTRYHFKLAEESPVDIAGGILSASAMAHPQLLRRKMRPFAHLQHRLFDPQLYLSDINALVAGEAVAKLGTYPWFRCAVDAYESARHPGGLLRWQQEQAARVRESWPGAPTTDDAEIAHCARAAIEFQVALGCEAIILPSPMTRVPSDYGAEARWLDAGLTVCGELRITTPVYATVAIADPVVRQMPPAQSAFLQAVTAQIASRPGLTGAYLVIAQESEDGYLCKHPNTLLSLLVLVDDLTRGAAKEVIVNYMGTFGAVAAAAGARVWSTGFYRSQRRLRTSDLDDSDGRTFPRYYSLSLLGDIGVQSDLALVARHPRAQRALIDTSTSARVNAVLRAGGAIDEVPGWIYAQSL